MTGELLTLETHYIYRQSRPSDFRHQFRLLAETGTQVLICYQSILIRLSYYSAPDSHFTPLQDAKLCALTVIGVDEKGHKHLLAIEDGMHIPAQREQCFWPKVNIDSGST